MADRQQSDQPTTEQSDAPQVKRALIIAAHPDDPEFGCGGTAATWARAGHEVYYVVCTNGNKGSAEPGITSDGIAAEREVEQRDAARVIGAKDVFFLRFPDGELAPDLKLREAIVRVIRTIHPDAVFTHDPANIYGDQFINHPDHQAVGHAVLNAVYPSARDRLMFPEHEQEGLQAHKVREVYLWGSHSPNEWVDISDAFPTKIEALACHRSQIKNPAELEKRMRERSRALGEARGLNLAEAFFKITMAR